MTSDRFTFGTLAQAHIFEDGTEARGVARAFCRRFLAHRLTFQLRSATGGWIATVGEPSIETTEWKSALREITTKKETENV